MSRFGMGLFVAIIVIGLLLVFAQIVSVYSGQI